MRLSIICWFSLLGVISAQPQHIASTYPQPPQRARESFKVPAGFEVQLVAAEPDIGKPMQMAFDAKGRLWVTTSREYPMPAKERGRDRLFILEDIDAKGKAKKITTFADDLNIPIGILPLSDGKSQVVYSIPNIWLLTDTDGDGKADKREILYGPFGTKDTHGMANSFTEMPDGWIYACHGFSNDTKVKGKDGHEVVMNSGNTFRFKADGSRIEIYTRGQVNPFGMTVDPNGFLYTADCHSKPLTQLIPKGYHQSFGKPHDGLGFAPDMILHNHGSTGICGPAWYNADLYPKEYKGCMFLCNVVTNRVHRDRIEFAGSTPRAVEQEEFMVSNDPWFRPVDLKVGPDGALYVADFYNRIIGHYEVPLDHAGRDRERGRIWRVVPKGKVHTVPKPSNGPITIDWPRPKRGAWNEKLVNGSAIEKRWILHQLIETPNYALTSRLLEMLPTIPKEDTHLLHATRIALRDCLLASEGIEQLNKDGIPKNLDGMLDEIWLGVPNDVAAAYLLNSLVTERSPKERRLDYVRHVARYQNANRSGDLLPVIFESKGPSPAAVQEARAALSGFQQRGLPPSDAWKAAVVRLCAKTADLARPEECIAGMELAGEQQVREQLPFLKSTFGQLDLSEPLRIAAMNALARIDAIQAIPVLAGELMNAKQTNVLREKAATTIGQLNTPESLQALVEALKTAPSRLDAAIALALAGTPRGSELLLKMVEEGKASPRLLQDKVMQVKLTAFKDRVAKLTAGLPSPDARIAANIAERKKSFNASQADPKLGKELFAKHCGVCHQIAGVGAKFAPQLDGVGIRGLDRLLEDILDPNRNVDAAFRQSTLNLSDGKTLSGLIVREEGETLVLVDQLGKEQAVPKSIDERKQSNLSPMPANWHEQLSEGDFRHLAGYLSGQRTK